MKVVDIHMYQCEGSLSQRFHISAANDIIITPFPSTPKKKKKNLARGCQRKKKIAIAETTILKVRTTDLSFRFSFDEGIKVWNRARARHVQTAELHPSGAGINHGQSACPADQLKVRVNGQKARDTCT
jgi:hypothetical protein